jgi:lipoyl synthase
MIFPVSQAIAAWGLDYVVLTSVDRDELEDQGSNHFASTVRLLKQKIPSLLVECLTPDFRGETKFISAVANSGLDVYAHNIETVDRLQRRVRDYRAGYLQSIRVLEVAKSSTAGRERPLVTKTSLMLGLGERDEEIEQTLKDLLSAGVDVITLGQYLRPSKRHMSVQRYVPPEEFSRWGQLAKDMGFKYAASGPLVRSSYRAGELFLKGMLESSGDSQEAAVAETLH